MSESTIAFSNADQLRSLFGANDRYLRLIRDTVGVDVVIRDGELRVRGEEGDVNQALKIFAELQATLEAKRTLTDADVSRTIQTYTGEAVDFAPPPIETLGNAKPVLPKTTGQAHYVRAMREQEVVFCTGPAGSGTTYLAVAMAINALRTEQVKKIVLVRPAVEAGENLGFLPGDLLAKVNPYLRPLLDALSDIITFDQVQRYMQNDVIEIVPLAFMRGRTLNNTFIILDEAQNTTTTQMKMFLTRMGLDSRIVVPGDTTQIDMPSHMACGLVDAIDRLSGIQGVDVVEMTREDIVRHRLVAAIVHAYDEKRPTKSTGTATDKAGGNSTAQRDTDAPH